MLLSSEEIFLGPEWGVSALQMGRRARQYHQKVRQVNIGHGTMRQAPTSGPQSCTIHQSCSGSIVNFTDGLFASFRDKRVTVLSCITSQPP